MDERRTDLAVQVIFALSLGALAALWLSGVAARTLARPVGTLREAALALAAGQRSPPLTKSPAEFAPVFSAFGRMANDLSLSRDALEAAQRRTEAVLQHVASGVLAVNANCEVMIANPQAEAMLGVTLRSGTPLTKFAASPALSALVSRVSAFLLSPGDEASFDTTVKARQLNARLTRLPSGAVLTLDDVTELASAQRVLAWGEMARQVAHEIKNPLTPIRLGVQHLRRAYRDGRGDFSDILEKNVGRVLEEIDHLDEIARAFSRYGTAPAEREPPQLVPLAEIIQAVLALESLGESGVTWTFTNNVSAQGDRAWARSDELKEVLINLLENARLAHATTVEVQLDIHASSLRICVVDDGDGIAADVLPRIFEPHFSTRTSGSGLGLAISRRLIEGWGGTVDVTTELGAGTTVRILLRAADGAAN
ncbi:MAG: ATP-binding protein [Phycisphaerae bacterium]|nr:ATP-binding protein [Gemmatimonadaceae bacterium]